ncbi:hypothetical protein M513_10880 [Trichuris suis]|uniref:Tudor domain-containing protein n=1 Tax=Trichuris suis TaxID=68888 RepID=A0A085LTE1_9BILA|nr:hypothetical protein M513_10880 [Trichuris suis]
MQSAFSCSRFTGALVAEARNMSTEKTAVTCEDKAVELNDQRDSRDENVGKRFRGFEDGNGAGKTVPFANDAYGNGLNSDRKVNISEKSQNVCTGKPSYGTRTLEGKSSTSKGSWGEGIGMLIGGDTSSWECKDLLRDKVTYNLSDQEQRCVTDALTSDYSQNQTWKILLPNKRGDGRKERLNEVVAKSADNSDAKSGFPCSFKKEMSANMNEEDESICTRSKGNNTGKCFNAACAGYEGQWMTGWLAASSDDDDYNDDSSTDGSSKNSSKQERTKPSGNEQIAELSEGEIVEEADIEPYKQQDEFFTTGIAGVKLEPQVMHQVFIGNWFSPLEFHVVFAKCKPLLEALDAKLQACYSDSSAAIPFGLVKKGTPCCAMNHKSVWKRAMVESGGRDALIRFVDSGETRYCDSDKIKLLEKAFMELPPLAIRCQIIGSHRDIFYRVILDAFRLDCKAGKRRQVKFHDGLTDGILSVNLYNMDGCDLFLKHFGELFRKQEQAERQRKEAAERRNVKVDKTTGGVIREPDLSDSDEDKGLPANFNQAKEKKSKRSRRRNASKCCLYESSSGSEGQCSSNLLTTDHSPDDGFVENCSADNLKLSEGEIVEEADIEPYKQQDEFFTTGIAGVKLEPQVMHQVFIGDWFSPLEFHVVFAKCKPLLEALDAKLQAWYSDSSAGIPFGLVKKGTPCCAMNHKSVWKRAVVESGGRDTLIRFVDSGETRYCDSDKIKLLDKAFMELPPLAIRCQIIGSHRDIFYRVILDAFRLDCKAGKRRQVKFHDGLTDGILSVNLYNMDGCDLFLKHFGELFRKQQEAERQRKEAAERRNVKVDKTTGRVIREPDLSDSDEDYLCSEDEDVFVVQQLRNKPNTIMANREIVGLNQLSINDEEWPSLS